MSRCGSCPVYECENQAMEVLNRLHQEGSIDYADYSAIYDGLGEIDTLQVRDEALEKLWSQFADVPMNPETECIEEPFMGWSAGSDREEIWHWFDQRHSKGVAYLLYGSAEDYVPKTKQLYALSKFCIKCKFSSCPYNHGGECRFALVHESKPVSCINAFCEEDELPY